MAGCLGETGADGELVSSTSSALTRTFASGSMVIPLDTASQNTGALRAYGLVYKLLSSNVPVQWAIRTGKAAGGNDVTISAPATVNNLETGAAVAVPINYRGGPFIIDAADRVAALPIVNAWLASDAVTVVHTVTGTFTTDIAKTLTAASAPFGHVNQDHLETLAGATYDLSADAQLFGGAGVGLRKGYGTPDWRGLAGVRLGFGGHGAPASRSRELDRDGDGIPDLADRCPDQPEDKDGFEDADGCPDPDNDKDGIVDAADACPLVSGPVEDHGCPDTDRDGDGVVDRLDNCPDEKGLPENQGCPKKQLVKITGDKLEIIESVYFKTDRAVIEPRSFGLLDNVAAVLVAHDQLAIQVEGHTDSQGDDAYNKKLSQRRAEAVVAYLVKKGIATARLTALGFGEEKPIADNRTKEGCAQNRRVVFTVIGGGDKVKTHEQCAGDDTT